MINFFKKNYFRISIIIALASLVIMVFSHSKRDYEYVLGSLIQNIISPVVKSADYIADNTQYIINKYLLLTNTSEQNIQLKKQIKMLEMQNAELMIKLSDYERITKSVEFDTQTTDDKIYAKVIADIKNDYSRLLLIDKGTDDNVQKYQAVVDYNGIIGQVIRTSKNSALVQLITDIAAKTPVIVAKNRQRALLEGNGRGNLLLKLIPREDDIRTGDKIISSNIISVFPNGYNVGEVISVYKNDFGWFREAKIKPASDLEKIEEVFVIKNDYFRKNIELIKMLADSKDQNQ